MTLYFMQYNNYYNRITKKYKTVEEYYNNHNTIIKEGINFNPNDNVNTVLTVNWTESWRPDYALVENPETLKFTRWFVISSTRTRGNQYQLVLRHDLVADFFDEILDADCFIEKAIIPPENPFIFNNENITVNQIKTNEWPLKDSSRCAWIVGYYGKQFEDSVESPKMEATFQIEPEFDEVISGSVDDWAYKNGGYYLKYLTIVSSLDSHENDKTKAFIAKMNDSQFISSANEGNYTDVYNFVKNSTGITYPSLSSNNVRWDNDVSINTTSVTSLFNTKYHSIVSALQSYSAFATDTEYLDNVKKYNNKVVKFLDSGGNAQFRKIIITETDAEDAVGSVGSSSGKIYEVLYNDTNFKKYVTSSNQVAYSYLTNFNYKIERKRFSVKLETVEDAGIYTVKISNNKRQVRDSVYGMFCIPYPIDEEILINGIRINPTVSIQAANALAKKYAGAGEIYDVQILPFCPVLDILTENGISTSSDRTFDVITYKETNDSEPLTKGYIFYPDKCSFTLEIKFDNFKLENLKMSNETDMMRLVSPNFNGQFEFNPARNNGVDLFNVDCTYMPHTPYIHINPDFNGLYGEDYDDARGLICNGDFSLPLLLDQWNTYQLQNKNYQNVFNREIESLELHQRHERINQLFSFGTKAVSGGISGSMTGASMGAVAGPYGAIAGGIAGGIIGTAASSVGGIIDYSMSERLRNDAIDYRRDMFGYQLQNIQALPNSISKTTPFTYNNKIFPILEYYTCKDEEKNAVANKIAFNSMTVMAIGKLRDYIGNEWSYNDITSKGYIKGSLIRLENISEEFNVLNEISNEIYKGVYTV